MSHVRRSSIANARSRGGSVPASAALFAAGGADMSVGSVWDAPRPSGVAGGGLLAGVDALGVNADEDMPTGWRMMLAQERDARHAIKASVKCVRKCGTSLPLSIPLATVSMCTALT
eukprot:358311-Chlamydomonas_euryale.AAC.4